MITVSGTVGPSAKYLLTGMPVSGQGTLKMAFENNTAGTNLALCAGTAADFQSGHAALQLSDSGGPGFQFLTIVDSSMLTGKLIYVLRLVGVANAQFTLNIE